MQHDRVMQQPPRTRCLTLVGRIKWGKLIAMRPNNISHVPQGLEKLIHIIGMGRFNVAKRLQKSIAEVKKEKDTQRACREFKDGKHISIRAAAEAFGLDHSTLSRRLKGISECRMYRT